MEKVIVLFLSALLFIMQFLNRRGRLSPGPSMPMMNILCPGHPFGFSVLGSVVMASALLALNVKHSGTCYIFPDNLGDLKKK